LNEWILIEQLKQGDQTAFRKIVEAWQDLVYNTAMGIVQNPEDAEDVAQEVFVQVFESVHQFKGESKLSTWLYRITISKAMDHLRRKNRKKRFAFVKTLFTDQNEAVVHPPDFNHPGVRMENREKSVTLMKAVNQLPDNQKIAFTLHKIEGLSYQEISEVMETTISSVESLMHRAKSNLKKKLENFYGQDK
jgi:RNA polymerase sigma factor (sigma-70 family)